MPYSLGVSATTSPSTVTVFAGSSKVTEPMVMTSSEASWLPKAVYRRSCERTRAKTSMGSKGLVI